MAKTIDEGFLKLRRSMEITDLQSETTATRQKNVREAVEDELVVLDSFVTGSYQRNTMIAPLSEADIDIFVVLDPKYFNASGHQSLLSKLEKALRKTYTKTPKISPSGQAVTITFTDFKVDVVPAFYRKGGGYLIPNASLGSWISTNPKKHIEIWTAANKVHGGNLVPLIKMIKAWNRSRGLLRSFHLEVLALTVLNGVTISSFPSGVRYVFDKARDKIKSKLADPAGYSDDVAAHIKTQAEMDNIIKRLSWAYERCLEAEQLAAAGRTEAAFEKWNLVFKGYFPAYG